MKRLTYVIGIPGAGKSTAMRCARGPFVERAGHSAPFAITYWVDRFGDGPERAIELGYTSAAFPGTDTLSFSAQPKVVAWLADPGEECETFVGEGDRLGSGSFFDSVQGLGIDLRVVLIGTPAEEAARRRTERGSNQDLRWVAGRITKVTNLMPRVTHLLDGMKSPAELGVELRSIILD